MGIFWHFRQNQIPPKFIFINETSDHRFDESIRMSILAAHKRTGVQNAVVIVNQIDTGKNIEQVAHELFKELKVGSHNSGRGILYLFIPERKELKIEVGYTLEGVLPDVIVGRLELAAKSFIYTDRYQDFWAELINTLNIEVFEQEKDFKARESLQNTVISDWSFFSGGAGITSRSYSGSWDDLMRERKTATEQQQRQFRGSGNLEVSVKNYLQSLGEGIGDGNIDILSNESYLFRQITPMTNYQQIRNWRMYSKSGIDRTFIFKNLAFVFFKPGNPVLPLVFKKEDNVWRIQEALSWSLFQRFEDSMRVFIKFSLKGFSRDMDDYLHKVFGDPLYASREPLSVEYISATPTLGELRSIFFHLYWLGRSSDMLSTKKLEKLPEIDLWIAIDTFLNLGQMTKFVGAYEIAARRYPNDSRLQQNLKFYKETVIFKDEDWLLRRSAQ